MVNHNKSGASENSDMIELLLPVQFLEDYRGDSPPSRYPGLVIDNYYPICPADPEWDQPTFVLRPGVFAQCNPVATPELVINQLVEEEHAIYILFRSSTKGWWSQQFKLIFKFLLLILIHPKIRITGRGDFTSS